MTDAYYPNKTVLLEKILKYAIPELQKPEDTYGFTMPDGKYHIFIYVDNADEKLYVMEPNRVEDGAHEPFTGDTYLAAHGDYNGLMLGCLWCMERFEEDAREQAQKQPQKISIPLGSVNLVAEPGPDPSYKEIFIGLEDSDGLWSQDLAVVGGKYHYEFGVPEPVYEDNISVKVYTDKNNEDYTHNFTVGIYAPENEPTTWISVYKDALSFEDDDNLTEICVPTPWLLNKLREEGETNFNEWLNEYTADNTDMIARMALSEGVIIDCNDKRIPLMPKKTTLDAKIADAQAKQSASKETVSQEIPKEQGR